MENTAGKKWTLKKDLFTKGWSGAGGKDRGAQRGTYEDVSTYAILLRIFVAKIPFADSLISRVINRGHALDIKGS